MLFERATLDSDGRPDRSRDFYIVLGYDYFDRRPWWDIYKGQTPPDQSAFGPHLSIRENTHSRNLADGVTVNMKWAMGLINNRLTHIIEVKATKSKRFQGSVPKLGVKRLKGSERTGLIGWKEEHSKLEEIEE
jgi:hypothetical protein